MASKARSTQSLVNNFPGWSNTRSDEQSVGFQLFNTIGHHIDDMRKQLQDIADNYFLPSSIVSDIDLYYRTKLDDSYEFSKDDDDDTDFIFTPPTVSGYVGTVKYGVTIAEENDIETFWYKALPTRLSLGETINDDHFVASGYIQSSPLSPASENLHLTNHLTVKIEGGTSFIGITSNNLVRRAIVQIEGENREGEDVTEELYFIHDETQKTFHEFSEVSVSGIRVYGIDDPETTKIYVDSAGFNQDDYPIEYDFDVTQDKKEMPLFWSLGTTASGINTLNLLKYDIDDIELRIDGWSSKQKVVEQELLNELGTNITPVDLAVEPHSDRLWVVDSSNLYVYEATMPYPDLSLLEGKHYHAHSVIEPNTYYATLNEEIELNYIWRRPLQGMTSHRAWVTKPDGTTYSLEDGVEVTYHTDTTSWFFGEPVQRKIRDSEFYTLDQRGDYVYALEVRYTDETKSIDKRVVSVVSKEPIAQYSLLTLGITNVTGVDIDSEYNLWVLDNTGAKHKINKHYDNMLIDFTRKIIYFREPYTKVQVF